VLAGGVLLAVLQRRKTPVAVGNIASDSAVVSAPVPEAEIVPLKVGGEVEDTARLPEVATVQRPSPVAPAVLMPTRFTISLTTQLCPEPLAWTQP
jgi:hypothetical protein